jgi:hypothetical protein
VPRSLLREQAGELVGAIGERVERLPELDTREVRAKLRALRVLSFARERGTVDFLDHASHHASEVEEPRRVDDNHAVFDAEHLLAAREGSRDDDEIGRLVRSPFRPRLLQEAV